LASEEKEIKPHSSPNDSLTSIITRHLLYGECHPGDLYTADPCCTTH